MTAEASINSLVRTRQQATNVPRMVKKGDSRLADIRNLVSLSGLKVITQRVLQV